MLPPALPPKKVDAFAFSWTPALHIFNRFFTILGITPIAKIGATKAMLSGGYYPLTAWKRSRTVKSSK